MGFDLTTYTNVRIEVIQGHQEEWVLSDKENGILHRANQPNDEHYIYYSTPTTKELRYHCFYSDINEEYDELRKVDDGVCYNTLLNLNGDCISDPVHLRAALNVIECWGISSIITNDLEYALANNGVVTCG